LVEAVLDDWQSAPLDQKVGAVLGLLEKLTLAPERTADEDVERVRAAGVSDEAIEDAILVCALFNIINRLADALDFDTSLSSKPEIVAKGAQALLKFGYNF
jgi:alkylhydroperoxidase family enzyme